MAELVDALDSKSGSRKGVRVRFPLRPPRMEAKGLLFCGGAGVAEVRRRELRVSDTADAATDIAIGVSGGLYVVVVDNAEIAKIERGGSIGAAGMGGPVATAVAGESEAVDIPRWQKAPIIIDIAAKLEIERSAGDGAVIGTIGVVIGGKQGAVSGLIGESPAPRANRVADVKIGLVAGRIGGSGVELIIITN